jgi:TonB family protein
MNIPEEFGNYLLLKKLREDALGETFRAGRVGRDGIEQVVLLRVFNGQGMDGEKLWQRISGRAAVQQALRSPNIGTGVDLGKVRSFPYAAYDYISGKNLATLFAQAVRQRQPIPIDHALLITERLALALAAAYETRAQDERLLHGFVAPHLVMISNEGETRMLGFEVAPGLRDLWAGGWRNDDLRGYLAPEAAATAAATRTDDVYSLGAILFELLASERLPLPLNGRGGPADGAAAYGPLASLIDGLVLPNEGTPLPAAVAALLKKSLAPPDQRIPDAVTWHKTISKLMIDGQFTSTTFNLAFFMHNLFRDEIDRESQEIEAEKKLELPPQRQVAGAGPAALAAGAAAGMAATHAGAAGAAEARERTGVRDAGWAAGAAAHAGGAGAGAPQFAGAGAATSHPSGSDRKPLWIGLAAAALLAIGVGGYLLLGRGRAAPKPATQPGGAAGTSSAAAVTAAESARNAAALQAQIQQMIEARSKDLESKLKSQYDDNIKQLQKKLEESRKAAAASPDKDKTRGERPAASAAAADTAGQAAPDSQVARGERRERTEPASSAAPGAGAGATPGSSRTAAAATSASTLPAAPRDPAASSPAAANPAAVAAASTAPLAPAADTGAGRQPQLQTGDLVQAGPGVVLPRVVSRPAIRYPTAARRMNRSAEVTVRVLVDEQGRVEKAERLGSPVGLGFDEAALEVARLSSYNPATKEGVRVKMWTTMKVTFQPN